MLTHCLKSWILYSYPVVLPFSFLLFLSSFRYQLYLIEMNWFWYSRNRLILTNFIFLMKTRNESNYQIIFLVKNLQSECVGLSIEGTDSDEDENIAEIQLGSTTYQKIEGSCMLCMFKGWSTKIINGAWIRVNSWLETFTHLSSFCKWIGSI